MIKNIVFDIGGVLAGFKWREYLDRLHFPKDEDEILENYLFRSPYWAELDRGEETTEEILSKICAPVMKYESKIRAVFFSGPSCVVQYDYAPKLLETLKEQGYKIYLLSNYGKFYFEEQSKSFEFLNYIDGKVISYEVRTIKPEPEIYKILMKKYRLRPEETLFFDDLSANTEAAEALGMKASVVTDYESIVSGLSRHGIGIDRLQ